jgi:hypothetical protein
MDDSCRGDVPSQTFIESVLAVLEGEHRPTVNGFLNFILISFIYPTPSLHLSFHLFISLFLTIKMDDSCRGDVPSQTVIESVLAVLEGEHRPIVNGKRSGPRRIELVLCGVVVSVEFECARNELKIGFELGEKAKYRNVLRGGGERGNRS